MIENLVTTLRKNGIATSFTKITSKNSSKNYLISTVKDGKSFNTVAKEIGLGKPIFKPFPIHSPTSQYAVIFHIASVNLCMGMDAEHWNQGMLAHFHPNSLIEKFEKKPYTGMTYLNLLNDYTINMLSSAELNFQQPKKGLLSKLFS